MKKLTTLEQITELESYLESIYGPDFTLYDLKNHDAERTRLIDLYDTLR